MLPVNWREARLRSISSSIQTGPFGSQLHSNEYISGGIPVINPSNLFDGLIQPDYHCSLTSDRASTLRRHQVEPGDILIGRRGELGRCATVRPEHDGWICGTGCLRLRPLQTRVLPEFVQRCISNIYVSKWLSVKSVGSTMDNLSASIVSGLCVPLPSLNEQDAIVRFLEEKERDIERYLATKRRMIEVLEEQRMLVVERVLLRSRAARSLTRPVPWFGDVPNTWRTYRLKHVASHIVDCLHETPEYLQDGEFPAIRTADVIPGRLDVDHAKRVDHATYLRRIERLKPVGGDIVYSREGERFGIAASVPTGVDLCVSQRMMHFRIRPEFYAEYIMWLLNSRSVYLQASVDQNGATAPHVNVERIRNFLLVVPDLSAQREMVGLVEREVSELDASVSILEREITVMEEYRTRLIADAVTGQIDVRGLG